MYIKQSGTALKDMTIKKGWRKLRVCSLLSMLQDGQLGGMAVEERERRIVKRLYSACEDGFKSGGKPSVESGFHSLLDRFVIHLHPAAVLAYACCKDGEQKIKRLFRDEGLPVLWAPYADPGYMLAKKIEKFMSTYKSKYGKGPAVLILQNHGLVVTAKNAERALGIVRKVVDRCRKNLKQAKKNKIKKADTEAIERAGRVISQAILEVSGKKIKAEFFIDEDIAIFMMQKNAARLCAIPAVTPDELVYTNGPALWIDKPHKQILVNKLKRRMDAGEEIPCGFLVKRLGLFVAAEKEKTALLKDVASTYLQVRRNAYTLGKIRALNRRQREFVRMLTEKGVSA
jgi:rhamnose utilization protein RhaD (predicted bifunctional aldolase and dehydrogenase)